jgi:NADH-quinone oxidoreductase subunit L
MSHLLWLIPVLPLAGFLVNGLLRLPKPLAGAVGCAGPLASFALSVAAFLQVHGHEAVTQTVFPWITTGDLNVPFGLRVDALSAIMILVVTGVGSLIHLYSISYMHDDEGFSRFFAYLNLFMFAMLVLVLGDSILLMFVGWEGVGLCSYLLIGFWYKDLKNADAGKKAFITNRIGDFGFLLGIFCLWALYKDVNFAQMAGKTIPHSVQLAGRGVSGDTLAFWAGLCLFIGACGKSAQIPLYVWLPDAMAGPTPVSALIHAATMVTAGVYMMARMNFLYAGSEVLAIVVTIAALTAFMAGLIAVAQNDIKKVLAYSTVSQLGFMFAGIASGEFRTGMFHVVTHAFFKALLFLGAGAVIHALHGEQDIRKMGGLGKKLPALAAVFVAGALALAGLPLSAGFYSKDAILAAVFQQASVQAAFGPAWLLLVASAGLTAFYTTRLVLIVFLDKPEGHGHDEHAGEAKEGDHHEAHELHKPGLLMMAPLAILAVLSLFGGALLDKPLAEFLKPVWGEEKAAISTKAMDEAEHRAHSLNVKISIGVFLAGVGLGWWFYGRAAGRDWVKRFAEGGGRRLHWLLENKFFVDEIYEYTIIAPVKMGATIVWFLIDRVIIDTLLVNGTGWIVYAVGGALRRTHTGSINVGVLSFAAGALALLGWVAYQFLFVADNRWQLPFLH